jgi:formylglycine-generating enzyme required for sulfatase activity
MARIVPARRADSPRAVSGTATPIPATAAAPVKTLDLGNGVTLDLVKLPGANTFWMGRCEMSNRQYAQFDPAHDSGIEVGDFLQFSVAERGFPMNTPTSRWPASPGRARGRILPLALRQIVATSGAADRETMDARLPRRRHQRALVRRARHRLRAPSPIWPTWPTTRSARMGWDLPSGAIPAWRPAATNVNDGFRVSAPVGHFAAHPWGLFDVQGNVSEWTRTLAPDGRQIVCGGSFADRPAAAGAGWTRRFPAWRRIYNVGFRVVIEEDARALSRH